MSRTEPAVPAGEPVRDGAGYDAEAPAGHGAHTGAPPPAGRRRHPRASALGRAVVPVLLVLAALFGTYGGAVGPGAGEVLPAAAGAADPGAETHEAGEAEPTAAAPRSRSRHGAAPRDGGRRRGPAASGPAVAPVPVPVPSPRDDARRCVVMRC
ncbi:hypothetical protein [Streptomyces sp. NPDC056527]|uniref:hypothetical protein n=1 Tax=Streptomyces sp. NPDC056527 TaxID=3345853 RepID=UPI0036750156